MPLPRADSAAVGRHFEALLVACLDDREQPLPIAIDFLASKCGQDRVGIGPALLVERQPDTFYFTDHYKDYPMVLVRLSKAKRAAIEPLLRRHWRTLASKAAVREFDMDKTR